MIASAQLQSTSGPVILNLDAGRVTLIAGPNGVGKSALLYSLYKSLPQGLSTYLPGHRQINFNNGWDNLGQDVANLANNLYIHSDSFNRYKGAWAEDQFKSLIRRLMNTEAAFNREFRSRVARSDVSAITHASIQDSPLDTLNLIFRNAGLLIQFIIKDTGLSALRGSSKISVDALSDGERASLFLACAFITQQPSSVLLIDEPEKHLHPSITGILIESALRARPDIAVVLSSHDVSLIERLAVDAIVFVKDSTVIHERPEQRQFQVELLPAGSIPDEYKSDILGSRSKVLFVEGTDVSRASILYQYVFEGWKVVPKGGAEKVIEAVRGLRPLGNLHWLKACGLVDKDGRDSSEIDTLMSQHVLVLPVPTIENLFFIPEMQEAFVSADLQLRGGACMEERRSTLKQMVLSRAPGMAEDIVARRTCWAAQRALASNSLSVADVRNDRFPIISVSVSEIKERLTREVENTLAIDDADRILFDLPIKNSDMPDQAARSLGAASFQTYCDIILRQIETKSPAGMVALARLKGLLPSPVAQNDAQIFHLGSPTLRMVGTVHIR